jgi:hypothetical protein
LDALELEQSACHRAKVVALLLLEVGSQEAPSHYDDPLWPGDLELEVGVVGDGHELRVARPTQNRMV